MKRRHFLRNAATASLAAGLGGRAMALEAENSYRKDIGIQLYTLRNPIAKDVVGTLKAVAAAGYRQVEPYGFPNADAMIRAAKDSGLAVHSSHFDWDCVVNPKDAAMSDFSRVLEKAKAAGLSDLVIPYLAEGNRDSLDAYKKVADHSNKAAAMAKEAGVRLSYHNHSFEFEPKERGKSGFDVLTAGFSKDMMFEIDVFWVKAAGLEPAELIRKLTGRVSQLHLKDLKDGIELPNFGGMPDDAFQELGDGIIPMEPILAAAKAAGVVHCHVEQDQSPDPLASIRQSLEYLKSL
jgi:sugar phosphate isomerase/epimerase